MDKQIAIVLAEVLAVKGLALTTYSVSSAPRRAKIRKYFDRLVKTPPKDETLRTYYAEHCEAIRIMLRTMS